MIETIEGIRDMRFAIQLEDGTRLDVDLATGTYEPASRTSNPGDLFLYVEDVGGKPWMLVLLGQDDCFTIQGRATVVLSDLKTPSTARHPFSLFYDELQRAMGRVKTVVAGGVSFGDLPINRLIAAYLAEDVERRLVVWRPSGTGADEVFTMLKQLPGGNRAKRAQVIAQPVSLPDAAAVDALD